MHVFVSSRLHHELKRARENMFIFSLSLSVFLDAVARPVGRRLEIVLLHVVEQDLGRRVRHPLY